MHATGSGTILRQIFRALISTEMSSRVRENAKLAGVDHLIHFQQRPVAELSHPKKYGFLITNPPYGERLEDKKDLPALYQTLTVPRSRFLVDVSDHELRGCRAVSRQKADKNRKISMNVKTYFYQYAGPKPPRQKNEIIQMEEQCRMIFGVAPF